MEIREPAPEDAEALGRMHHAAWREAYSALLPPALWEGDEARKVAMWRQAIAEPGPETSRIAVVAGAIVGVATAGPTRPVDGVPVARDLELWSINVLASEHGGGAAARLLESVLEGRPAELWTFEANHRARAFYGKHGFLPDGARQEHVAFGDEPEVRLVR